MGADIFTPERQDYETQDGYRIRQKEKQVQLKAQKRGQLFWDSYAKGTYKKGAK